ncbi:hypothetical protein RRM46_002286 [Flavobacterium psychrophilum]|nr:hypothetical protein [Flavobacterium psychrophilum]
MTKFSKKTQTKQSCKTGVSGSFSSDDVKWLLFYGYTKDKTVDLNTEQKVELDYFIEQMFETMKETSRFNVEMVKDAFWERIEAIANYKNNNLQKYLVTYRKFIEAPHALLDDEIITTSKVVEVKNPLEINELFKNIVDVKRIF